MSSTFTMYGRQQMLLAYWSPDAGDVLSSAKVCLCTAVPPANAAVSQLQEPDTADGYARITVPMDSDNWGETGFAELYNLNSLIFNEVTDDWGLIVGFAIADTTSGQCLAVGSLAEPFAAITSMEPTIEPQGIVMGLYD